MAKTEIQVTVFNKALKSFRETLEKLKNETPKEHLHELNLASGLFSGFLADRRIEVLEEVLHDKGLEICHYADIHYHTPKPDDYELSEKEWKLGFFPKSQEKLLFRAWVLMSYGRNATFEVRNPQLISLCPEHYPKYSVETSSTQTKNGWLLNIQSGVTLINGKMHPIAEPAITLENHVMKNPPELAFRHFGFIS